MDTSYLSIIIGACVSVIIKVIIKKWNGNNNEMVHEQRLSIRITISRV